MDFLSYLLGIASCLVVLFLIGLRKYQIAHRHYNPKHPEEAWYYFNMHDERQ